MKINFKAIGYYICEINDTPEWLQGISRQILPVSGCIGEQHPRCECGKYGMKGYLRYCPGFKRKLSGMPLKACSISFRLYTNNSEKTFSPLCEANLRNLSSVFIFDFLNKHIKILNAFPVLDSSSDEKRSISFKRFSCNSLAFIRCETK